jgi:hypothetical protein
MSAARQALLDASAELEALRPQANIVIGPKDGDEGFNALDNPIRQAWTVALGRYRVACELYVSVNAAAEK